VMRTLLPLGPISRAEFDTRVPTFLVDNNASRRVMEKIGLRYEKTFQFHGLAVAGYSLSRTDYRADDAQYRLVVSEDDRKEGCYGKRVLSC
jgi:hypothetical protein